jgi:putative ABC transport system permease protein
MRWIYTLPLRFRSLFRKNRVEQELTEELRFHLEQLIGEKIANGMTPEEARYAALRELGGVEQIKEECRDMRRMSYVENLRQDIRHGLRQLRRSPGFTAVAIITLALGIGANTAIFTLLDAILLRHLPVPHAEQLYQVRRSGTGEPERLTGAFTNALWQNLRQRQDVFSGMAAWGTTDFNLSRGGAVERAQGLWASGDYFGTLEVRPALGRLITPDDDHRGCPGIAVLSYGFWERHYAGAASAIGRTISLDSHPFEVVGIAPAGFHGLDVGAGFDVAAPICATVLFDGLTNSRLDDRSSWWLTLLGRIKPDVSPRQMNARLSALAPQVFAASLPQDWDAESQKDFLRTGLVSTPAATGTSFTLREQFRQPLLILMGVVGVVLLIACANVAALMLARAVRQSREISVRLALGATRARLICELLTHSMILALAGAAGGVLLAHWGTRLLVRNFSTSGNELFLDLSPDWRVLGFTVAVAIFAAILFGILPALRSSRTPLVEAMRGGTAFPTERRSALRRWMVASQIALSLVLVVTAGLFLHSFWKLVRLDPGFDEHNVLLVISDLRASGIKPEDRPAMFEEIQSRLRTIPGVVSVSRSEDVPLSGRHSRNVIRADAPEAPTGVDAESETLYASPGYLAAMRMPLVAGRDFNSADVKKAPRVAIVNRAFARKFFGSLNPIGRVIRVGVDNGTTKPPVQVVGIVGDAKYMSLREAMPPTVFMPLEQYPEREGRDVFEVRTAAQPASLIRAVVAAVAGVSREIPLEFNTLKQEVDDAMLQDRLLAILSVFFGAVALLLAMVGLYGTVSYRVTMRRAEYGIRMALGAEAGSIVRLVIRDVATLLLAGEAAGIGVSLLAASALRKLLFGIGPRDPTTIAASALFLGIAALAAGYLPARRATKVDPMVALRHE